MLIHQKQQQIALFLEQLVCENNKFLSNDYGLNKSLMELLSSVQEYFKQVGLSTKERSVSQLRNYLGIAISGIDPITLVRVKTHRRDTVKIACYHCLSQLSDILESAMLLLDEVIDNAKDDISQVILSAYQANLISDTTLNDADSFEKCELLWNKLKENQQVLLIDKKLKLKVLPKDIIIILDKTLTKLKE